MTDDFPDDCDPRTTICGSSSDPPLPSPNANAWSFASVSTTDASMT